MLASGLLPRKFVFHDILQVNGCIATLHFGYIPGLPEVVRKRNNFCGKKADVICLTPVAHLL